MKTKVDKLPKITPSSDSNSLCEIMQHNKTEFALCKWDTKNDELIQCHQFVHCRDFMIDAVVGNNHNKDMGIYGFKYTKNNPRLDADICSLLLNLPSQGELHNFQENFPILKEIEDNMGWVTSFAELVNYPKRKVVVWVGGDSRWQQNALFFSLYSYLLKCLTYKIIDRKNWMKEIQNTKGLSLYGSGEQTTTVEAKYMDPDYLNFLFLNWEDIHSKYKNFSGWFKEEQVPIHQVHDQSGFVSCRNYIYKKPIEKSHCLYGFAEELKKKAA